MSRLYRALRYRYLCIWDIIRYDIPSFFKNIWDLRLALWDFRPWDSAHSINLFLSSLEIIADSIEKNARHVGYEKNVRDMRRLINGLHRVIWEENQIVTLNELHPDVWPCYCRDSGHPLEFMTGCGLDESKFICNHVMDKQCKNHRENVKYLFNEIAKKYQQWWN
jgi:hypothetical protein